MTPLEATNALMQIAIDGWNAADAVLIFEAERREPPASAPWIRVTIRDLPTDQVTHGAPGNRLARRRATLIAQVFWPLASGDGQGRAVALATTFRDLYEARDVVVDAGTVNIIGGATVRRVGVDGAWYQVNVDVPIAYHETI